VKSKTKRNIASWVLLAIFVPTLFFASIHVHHSDNSEDTECVDCVHHQCSGHLTQQTTFEHVCLFCQILTLPMVAATIVRFIIYREKFKANYFNLKEDVYISSCDFISLRAPPVFLS
jgi:hypothetical protein